MPPINRTIGLFFIRCLLGIILLMQGYGKVFTWGINKVYQSVFAAYEAFLPKSLIWITAYYTSYVELIGGALLLLGLFRRYTYVAIVLLLLIVSFGHGLKDAIWDLQHVMPRAILLATLLLLPADWDRWSLDERFSK